MKIQFLGANRQVTGSCYFFEAAGLRLLLDCGLYQERPYLERNWDTFPVPPHSIDFVLLTHAHLDHSGLLPRLVQQGFSKKILTTSASAELVPIVLLDSAHIQEEDAVFKRKRHQKEGRKGAHPEIPLYRTEDAEQVFPLLEEVPYEAPLTLNEKLTVIFHDAGHILGSSMLELVVREKRETRRFIFTGDIGQWNKPLIRDPSVFRQADYVIMESTYGDRNHEDPKDIKTMLCDIIKRTREKGGNVVIPTFAIERAQELLFYLNQLEKEKRILILLTFLDSPMAVDVTEVFKHHPECLDEEGLELFQSGQEQFRFPGLKLIHSTEESKAINSIKGTSIIMAGSGMCTGGRIKHHLAHNISRPESTILFVGYQAKGTLGRQILDGAPQVRIHGQDHSVRAQIEKINGFSAHADRKALFHWLSFFQTPPKMIFLTHGDEEVSAKLARDIKRKIGTEVILPIYKDTYDLF